MGLVANAWGDFREALRSRADAWINPWTGQGTARDKTAAGYFEPIPPLQPQEAANLYHGDGIAGRIVDLVPKEMMRQGFTITREGADDSASEVRAVTSRLKELDAAGRILEAMIWGRCMGGALLFVGVDDGARAEQPLRPERAKGIAFLQVYDRRRVSVQTRYADPRHPRFGEPETYRIDPIEGNMVGDGAGVHETRCIRFGGALTAEVERRALDSWDYSVLQKPLEGVRRFHGVHNSAELLMTDASQGVWKMHGFIDSITSGQSQRVWDRLIATDMGRSVARSLVLDADPKYGEEFSKIQNSFAGIGDMLDRVANYLSAVTEIPVTVLMGQAPAGLAATGDADVRMFYDRVQAERSKILEPVILRLVSVLTGGDTEGWKACFPPLWQESPNEKSAREKLEAERDALYIANEVVTPEEVALSPHVAVVYPGLDRSLRETLAERDRAAELDVDKPSVGGADAPTIELVPTDLATVVTVNEVRASKGLAPLEGPDGALTMAEYKAKHATVITEATAATEGGAPAPAPPAEEPAT